MVVWEGIKDAGRNETRDGLNHTQAFVRKNSHTNVILMSVPHRYDLDMNSCVNKQVKEFNRKLRKQMKIFEKTVPIKVDPDSDLFKGKELASKKTVTTVKYI